MKRIFIACTCLALLLSVTPAFSQLLTSNLTARAEDPTGAVIPGVEVTISSPAMIGGARKEVTDETGQYRFTVLPPGVYRVSFALPGFKTLNITDTNLTAGSTATVVGKMEVASTAEEVTVSSQAPTIDLESATIGVNISQKMMDELPWSRSLTGMSMMIPGVRSTSFDIGNSNFGTSSTIAASSGGRSGGNVVTVDGLVWCQTYSDYGSFEEMNVSTNAKGADQMNSGITLGMVVKSGGNQFHGNVSGNYQNGSMQSNNITTFNVATIQNGKAVFTDTKKDLYNPTAALSGGFSPGSNKTTHFDDIYGDIGGPIKKDKLWFYYAYRRGYQGTFIPGFRTAVGGPLTDFWTMLLSHSAKLTYQLTERQKLEAYVGLPDKHQPYRGGGKLQPKEATQNQDSWSSQGPMLTYTNIINSKTTLTAKITRGGYWWPAYTYGFNGDGFDGLGPNIAQLVNGQLVNKRLPTLEYLGVKNVGVHISDTTTGAVDGAFNSNYARPIRWQEDAALSRFASIGGKNHELKVGYQGWWDKDYSLAFGYPYQQAYTYQSTSTETCPDGEICSNYFLHPYRVTVYDYPSHSADGALYRSAYGNDKITWNRKLTVNVGLRYDWATTFLPPQGNDGSGPYARKFEITQKQHYYVNADGSKSEFPVYNLFSPRLSFAYDLFGNGKLALKGSWGRYIGITSSPNSQPGVGENNPISSTSCTYNGWDGSIPFDAKKNAGPDGIILTSDDLNLSSSSCGRLKVLPDGTVVANATYHWDSNLKPNYVSEYTGGIDYGISRDFNVRFSFQRKFDRNGSTTVNTNLSYADYTDIRCADDRGPDGVVGTADDNPFGKVCAWSVPTSNARFNAPTNTFYQARDQKNHESNSAYTGYTFTFNKNYSHRWQAVASLDVDMAHSVNSTQLTPNGVYTNYLSRANDIVWHQSFKTSGIYSAPDLPLLKGFKLSGLQYSASFIAQDGSFFNRQAQVSDGRGSTVTVTVDPRFGRYPALFNWDHNIRKKFKIGETKQSLEFVWTQSNVMNANTLRSWSTTNVNSSSYFQGDKTTPLRPSSILVPRIYQWAVTYKF